MEVSNMRLIPCFCSLACSLCSVQVHSQGLGGRAGTWEAGFHVVDMSAVSLDGIAGSFLDVDDDIGYGFTGAYNFTNRFAVMLDVNWAKPDYTATFVPDGPGSRATISTNLDVVTIQAKGVFHLLEDDLTPFIEAGVGWTNVDSNIIEGPPITGCWWDPWWGYICESFYETYSETRTSYSAGFGIRWDMSSDLALRGSVGILEVDTGHDTEDARVDTVQFDFAWRF
jgi:opacity protein-like surface antigen